MTMAAMTTQAAANGIGVGRLDFRDFWKTGIEGRFVGAVCHFLFVAVFSYGDAHGLADAGGGASEEGDEEACGEDEGCDGEDWHACWLFVFVVIKSGGAESAASEGGGWGGADCLGGLEAAGGAGEWLGDRGGFELDGLLTDYGGTSWGGREWNGGAAGGGGGLGCAGGLGCCWGGGTASWSRWLGGCGSGERCGSGGWWAWRGGRDCGGVAFTGLGAQGDADGLFFQRDG